MNEYSSWLLPGLAQGIPPEEFGSLSRRMLAIYNFTNCAPEANPWTVIRKAVGGGW